ncbi:MAG: hypothetical protein WAZ98_05750 [Cyclobacteriaceae bacterium]
MKHLPFLLAALLSWSVAHCQSVSTLMGSRANAVGYSSSTLSDTWSIFNNVAGLAQVKNTIASFTYDLHPSIVGANRTAAAFSLPIKFGTIGTGAYRFGDNLYNEQMLTVGFGNQFGLAALGASINYIQYRTEGFGSKGVVSINLGGIANLTPHLSIGAYILNINQPSINQADKLPTKLVAGLGYKPIEKVLVAIEIEKDLEYNPLWKMGMEYKLHEKFVARTGFNLNPNVAFFGMGFKTKKFTIDYALQHSTLLNFSHQASVAYQFNKP